jgi:DNA processing protein
LVTEGRSSEARLAHIALGHLVEPGHRDIGDSVRQVGAVETLRRLSAGELPGPLCAAAAARLAGTDPSLLAAGALDRARRLGARMVTPEDAEWPVRLADLVRISKVVPGQPIRRHSDPPHCIWVRGGWRLDETLDRSVAIVGSRAATSYGGHVASELGFGLADQGWTVVSGGAFGIDAAAHRGALAAGGITVAILACGIDRPYPASHTSLFERIGEAGLLVSEWPPGSDPHRRRFLIRNRVIAAATRGTVMVEANLRSGARYTLGRARDLGRGVLVVPGPITSAMSTGCHEELRTPGARLVSSVAHIVEEVGRLGEDLAPHAGGAESPLDRLAPLQAQILDGVRPRRALSAEDIAAAAGVSGREARQTLPSLVELGLIEESQGRYRLAAD